MNYKEAKEDFIQSWGAMGSSWGINRTMAQIHALLMISPKPLVAEQIINELGTSQGNTNVNLRELISWGLVKRVHKAGDRKEYYEAIKDVHKIAVLILKERRKKELEPLIQMLNEYTSVEIDKKDSEEKAFSEMVRSIQKFSKKVDGVFEMAIKADETWIGKTLTKFLK